MNFINNIIISFINNIYRYIRKIKLTLNDDTNFLSLHLINVDSISDMSIHILADFTLAIRNYKDYSCYKCNIKKEIIL